MPLASADQVWRADDLDCRRQENWAAIVYSIWLEVCQVANESRCQCAQRYFGIEDQPGRQRCPIKMAGGVSAEIVAKAWNGVGMNLKAGCCGMASVANQMFTASVKCFV